MLHISCFLTTNRHHLRRRVLRMVDPVVALPAIVVHAGTDARVGVVEITAVGVDFDGTVQ